MVTWNFPALFVVAVVIAVAASFWLIRAATAGANRPPDFICPVCGRKQRTLAAREWRYCPYCGAQKVSSAAKSLPKPQR